MFDINDFKRKVKEWIRLNPDGAEQELMDFCEELIPRHQFAAHQWIVDQTVNWFRHIVANREITKYLKEHEDEY